MDYVVSTLEMRELERQTIEGYGVPARVLMEVAGRAVARHAHELLAGPSRIAVVCGPGNNGGDGFVAARALAAMGHSVRVFVFAERARLAGDAKAAFGTLERTESCELGFVEDARELWEFSSSLKGTDLVVDALLGTGLTQDVRGLLGDAIELINESGAKVVAVDLPSGIDADTGAIRGRAIRACCTATFAYAKRGHFLYPGAEHSGKLHVHDIGVPGQLVDKLGVVGRVVRAADGPALLPKRVGHSHKGSFGHVVLWAGSPETPGAAVLASLGALRAGAGLVSWAANDATLSRAQGLRPEVMLRVRRMIEPEAWAHQLLDGATGLVIGPGLGTDDDRLAELAAVLGEAKVPLCLDADALNLMARDPSLWERVRAPVVVTPHPKEMARLLASTVDEVQRDRFAAALQLAAMRSCIVVLKAAGTVVADPGGSVSLIAAGNPGLATGGTGDVLAGIIGSLLAQGIDPTDAAVLGALLHARAGDVAAEALGQAALIASDVVEHLGSVLSAWQR